VSQQQAAHYADYRAIAFREASAKSGANVNHIFAALAVHIFNRLVAKPSAPSRMLGGQDTKDDDEVPVDKEKPPAPSAPSAPWWATSATTWSAAR